VQIQQSFFVQKVLNYFEDNSFAGAKIECGNNAVLEDKGGIFVI